MRDWLQTALIGDLVSLEQQMDEPSERGPGRTRGSVTTLAVRSFILASLLKLTEHKQIIRKWIECCENESVWSHFDT